jgi:hypothetical protein
MFQFQDLEEKNEVVKNAFLYLLDKSAGKGMLHAHFAPLVKGQCLGSCALQTGFTAINILVHSSFLFTYLLKHLVILALFSTSKPNNKAKDRERPRKLNLL